MLLRENALDELANNKVLSYLSLDSHFIDEYMALSDEEKVIKKVAIARSIGHNYVTLSTPVLERDGTVDFLIQVKNVSQMPHCLALCIQGGLEGLYSAGIHEKNPNGRLEYVVYMGEDEDATILEQSLNLLGKLYESFTIRLIKKSSELSTI
jgi:hypothetical protein